MPESLFEEMKRYVRFEASDEAALRAFGARAAPHFTKIVDAFYARLLEHDQASRVFSGPEQVERLKSTLHAWLEMLLSGPWDEAYHDRRARIGRVHVRIALPQRYMFGAMNVIRLQLVELARADKDNAAATDAVLAALHKIIDLELAIMLESYREAIVDVRTRRAERLAGLGTMAAGLAHELRNPLNAAQLQLRVAERRLSDGKAVSLERAAHALDLAQTELQRLGVLVSDFLQFAKPQQLRLASIDLRVTAERLLGLLRPEAQELSVELVLEPGPAAPVEADEEKLKQVLLNLLRNALEVSSPGSAVRVRLGVESGQTQLVVEDSGPGVSPNAPIFEPFYTTKPHGTGLGLSIVHRIVLDHGGTIQVDSVPGRTLFCVTLPSAP